MKNSKTAISDTIKHKLTQALKPYNPQKIYIYGSYARGEAKKNSDLDVLIIKNTRKKFRDRRMEAMHFIYPQENLGKRMFGIPIEPIVYTKKELDDRLEWDPFTKSIYSDSFLIYEKDKPQVGTANAGVDTEK